MKFGVENNKKKFKNRFEKSIPQRIYPKFSNLNHRKN